MQTLTDIEYLKDLHHSYMVIPEGTGAGEYNYCVKMLQAERPEGMLKLEVRRINNRLLYYYDITSRQSLGIMTARAVLNYTYAKRLISDIIDIIETAYEYLLEEDDFVLLPEQIFMDILEHKPYLCYYPGYCRDVREQMSSLLEFIMNKVDYNDKAAVLLVYNLYAVARAEGFTLGQLKDTLKADVSIDSNGQSLRKRTERSIALPFAETCTNAEKVPREVRTDKGAAGCEHIMHTNNGFVPVMMERITGEREVLRYSPATYLYTASLVMAVITVVILGIKSGLMHNLAGRIDYSKLAALIMVLLGISGYVIRRLWDKKKKITKLIADDEYVDPRKVMTAGRSIQISDTLHNDDHSPAGIISMKASADKRHVTTPSAPGYNHPMNTEEDGGSGEYNPTCLLNAPEGDGKYMLKPCDEAGYRIIPIEEFPFFIGKLKKNMDYCLDREVVSRCHAKLTREEEHVYITDLNSTNGTFVNGELLQPYKRREITAGDEIAFADIRYQAII